MTPERWRQIEGLYHSALCLSSPERAAFLDQACASDPDLRKEVDSLLDHAADAGPIEASAGAGRAPSNDAFIASLIGRQVGSCRVESVLGTGGMGVVFRARELRLNRDVAIKVLPPMFTRDPERLIRFEREAQALAALNHPNIVTIHGVQDGDGIKALVMELVEGETLDATLQTHRTRGTRMGVRRAMTIAAQLADALEAAHDKGVVHRDLKPANIKITADDVVKVLDFGLARTSSPGGSETSADTRIGLVLGTAAYMSPEQGRGLPVDKRTDIWAFGCVLYEMLVGRPPFDGETVADVTSRVLNAPITFDALPPDTPDVVRRLVKRCLDRDSRQRLRDIGEARLDLKEALGATSVVRRHDTPVAGDARPRRQTIGVAAAVALLASVSVWLIMRQPTVAPAPVSRLSLALPRSLPFAPSPYRDLAISADGARLAYRTPRGIAVHFRDGRPEVLVRVESDAMHPFLSPDGQWIGYSVEGKVRKVPVSGGAPVTVATTGPAAMGSWWAHDIVFTDVDGLFRVPEDGGTPVPLPMTPLGAGEQASFPEPLPDGRTIIVTVQSTRSSLARLFATVDTMVARIEAVDVRSGVRRTLIHGGGGARYVPSGHLAYVAGGGLQAVAFDLQRVEVLGDPVQVAREEGLSDFATSDEGSLVYTTGSLDGSDSELVWVDRRGNAEPVGAPIRPYVYPSLSPDGRRVALVLRSATTADRDVWIWTFERKALEQLTVDPTDNSTVAWSPDGTHLAFGSARMGGIINIFWQDVNGAGTPERLFPSPRVQMPITFDNHGHLLASTDVPGNARDIVALSPDGQSLPRPVVQGPASEMTARVSPDGRWLAYDSDEPGQYEVYVRPYPAADRGRWVISTGGGRQPAWSRDGGELYYRDFAGAMMAVPISTTTGFAPGAPIKLFDAGDLTGAGARASANTYDVGSDGRFLMIRRTRRTEPAVVLTLNWFDELKRLAPAR